MSNSVSLTVPLEPNALRHAIKMLQGMESDLHSTPVLPTFCAEAASTAEANEIYEQMMAETDSQVYDPMLALDPVYGEQDQADSFNCGAGSYVDPSQAFRGIPTLGEPDGAELPPPPPPATTAVELDSEGMPWDARIHTVARTKVANGTWKLARNTPAELVASVKAEYLGNVTSPTTNNVTTAEQPVAPITDAPPPPPPSPPGTVSGDPVRQFMADIAKSGTMPSVINTALQKHGVQTLQLIRDNADKIPAIRLELGL